METAYALTASGIAFMTISWAAIIGLVVFCFSRIFRANKQR